MYESDRRSVNPQNGGGVKSKQIEDSTLGKQTNKNGEADFFPALQKYKDEHNTANLQKLMVEISEFCRSVYASTKNEEERKIYQSFIGKLNK